MSVISNLFPWRRPKRRRLPWSVRYWWLPGLEARLARFEAEIGRENDRTYIFAVGVATVMWAWLEMQLDRQNLILLRLDTEGAVQRAFPVSLKAKIELYRRAHNHLAAVSALKERGLALASRITDLKGKRHDMVHGIARERLPAGARKFLRHDYTPDGFSVREQAYTPADIVALLTGIEALHGDMNEHEERLALLLPSDKPDDASG